jgi:hypothetical protein
MATINTHRRHREETNMISKAHIGKLFGVAALLLAPLPAMAQYTYAGEPAPEVRRGAGPPSGFGAAVQLGGGVVDFTGATARSMTSTGGSWDLRLAFGTRSILGLEAAYVGSAQNITAAGLDPNAALIGNGAEAALRLNAPLAYRGSLVEPFAFGGAGWTQYNVVNDNFNTSIVREKDDVLTVPFGGGLAASFNGFMFDARFTYRVLYNQDLIGKSNLDNWIVSANLGSEF